MKYRKKPVIIEAYKFTGHGKNVDFIEKWSEGSCYIRGTKLPPEHRELEISTLEGTMRAKVGDYIIKGIQGEFYPCKPDIFELTYEQAETMEELHEENNK